MIDPGTRQQLLRSIDALDGWIGRNGWRGFDPHDIRGTAPYMFLLQPIRRRPLKVLRRLALMPLSAMEQRAPALARRLFGVQPTINAKGMALFARAYLQLFQHSGDERYRRKAQECLDWLEANRSPGYDEPAWGYPFNWQSGVRTPAGTPASVVMYAVGDAFWTAHTVLGEARYLDICRGICRFFLKHLNRDELPDGSVCFSYTPLDDFHVHNANLMVAEYLIRVGRATGNAEWQETGLRAGRYALAEQKADGSLHYWGKVQDHYCPGCIDHYHSGFEIRCLAGIARLTGSPEFEAAAERYYRFYREHLLERGEGGVMPRMTPHSVYPVNIHSCSEALLVACTMAPDSAEARELLQPILRWVLAHMQRQDGAFAYMLRRSRGRTVRMDFPFMRWGQAWSLLALSQVLLASAEGGDERA